MIDLVPSCQCFRRAQAQDDDDNQTDHEPCGNDGTSQVVAGAAGAGINCASIGKISTMNGISRYNDMPQYIETFPMLA